MAISIPVTESVVAIVTRISPQYVYENGKKTEVRVADETGRPLSSVSLFGKLFGDYKEFSASVPDVLLEGLQTKTFIKPMGADLRAQVSGADYGTTREKLFQVEQILVLNTADSVFDLVENGKWED